MLSPERLKEICHAADQPSDNLACERLRGMLGEVIDELLTLKEGHAAMILKQVRAMHYGRGR